MNAHNDNAKLMITKIKPRFFDRELLAIVAAESLAKLDVKTKNGKSWTNAIGKAVAFIEANAEMTFDLRTKSLNIRGSRGDSYTANGVCQCEAFENKMPCYHRAAARLIQRYVESLETVQ